MSGEYSIGDKLFPDIVHVLEFYNTHLLDTTTLLAPLPLESAAQNGVLSPNFIMEVEGLYNFYAKDPEDLSFKKGDHLNVLEKHEEQWWRAQSKRTLQIGCIPANYVREIPRARPVAAVQERPNDLQRSRSVLEPRLEKRAPKPLPPEPAAVTPAPVLAPRAPPVAPAAAAAAPPAGPVQPQRPKFIVARATMDRVANAYDPTALSFSAGDVIQVSVQNENGLWEGSVMGKEEKVSVYLFVYMCVCGYGYI